MPVRRSRRGSSGGQSRVRSPTARAELTFSVSHVERLLREGRYSQRLGASAPIFLAAVIQSLTAKVLELAGIEAQNRGRRLITPDVVDMVVHNHPLLSAFFQSTIISQAVPGWN
ncbi:histone H2A-Bbd type 2/3-like [Neofelis nebulosa]|uniref:histone H2A-Bbd type 2/3 n=1 Tax=Neofelis nebulosa TaxID=61452 RepID=UPI00272CBF3F|nr:histone H2A-Bbd type 2/3 [Neofelis nebulosa]XP_058569279.1 histone H2A-Bbd type 2/3 [Neofelis nebulosa]XP_058569476.1 histone H2A-Bbd type 2/3-like [Neofelis nebulosa]XP_058569477.1 histone H2A-Bbd type 2/3-like [Neofelis nebulosa]